jgi:peptide/nickel transport system substrate-binding protein
MIRVGLVLVTLAALMVAGSVTEAAPARTTGTLVIAKSDEPNSIDPHVHDGWYSVRAHSPVYETLVDMTWDPQRKAVVMSPLLAESWTVSPDGKVYTFRLRRGVKFHDGTPFTAEDVKATFERNRGLRMRASWQVQPIETIDTPDDYTVVIRLESRFTPFLMAMARAYIMSAEAIRANDQGDRAQRFFNANMIGTGPYKFVEWTRESTVTFVKNPDYWGGWRSPHFERIVLRHVPDPTTQRLLIERGEVDFAMQIKPDDAVALRSNPNITVEVGPSTATFNFPIKLRGPFAEPKVRQALAYSFPYDQAIQGIRRGFASRIYGPFPRGVPGYTEEGLIKYTHDPEKARGLLDEAGYRVGRGGVREKDGRPLRMEVWTIAALPFEKEAALLWQSALRDIGVEMRVTEQSAIATYVTATYNFDAPADAYGWIITMFIPDPHDIARQLHTRSWRGLNTSFWGNRDTDALIDRAVQLPPGVARTRLYEQLQKAVNQDPPHIWVWQEEKFVVRRKNLAGFIYNPVDYIREFRYHELYRQ